MPNAVAFLPWTYVAEPITVGKLRLLPFFKKKAPSNLVNVTQADIDGILSAYADRPSKLIRMATLLEIGDWYAGQDITKEIVEELYDASHYLAFSALSQRELFSRGDTYSNFHTYNLVVQGFKPGNPGTFAFTTRRRDGGTNQLWGSDMFAFQKPEHVVSRHHLSFDRDLLQALLELPKSHSHYLEAITEFNQANTDSSDVPEHVELVMCKSAFEWLFKIKSDPKLLVNAIKNTLAAIPQMAANGPLREDWLRRYQGDTELILAWAKDFTTLRGASAHGAAQPRTIYSGAQHLAFISMLFPLLVKKLLADEGRMTLSDMDIDVLKNLERYLVHNPFGHDWSSEELHPWVKELSRSRMRIASRNFYADAVD